MLYFRYKAHKAQVKTRINKMEWFQTLSIIATVIGSAYYIHRDVKEDMKTQTARTDRLYEMFIQLIQDSKK